jgi:hypothetical protein
VLDQRNGRLWTHVMAIDSANGVSVRSEKGRSPQKSEGPMALRWMEAEKWVQQRLTNLKRRRRGQGPPAGLGRPDRGDDALEVRADLTGSIATLRLAAPNRATGRRRLHSRKRTRPLCSS